DFTKAAAAKGKFIRPVGVVLSALIIVLFIVVDLFFAGPIVVYVLKSGLVQINGATVLIKSAKLNPAQSRLEIKGLEMADPENLKTNIISAQDVAIDIDMSDLLRKRITIDAIVLKGTVQGGQRKLPGHLIGGGPAPTPESQAPEPK